MLVYSNLNQICQYQQHISSVNALEISFFDYMYEYFQVLRVLRGEPYATVKDPVLPDPDFRHTAEYFSSLTIQDNITHDATGVSQQGKK